MSWIQELRIDRESGAGTLSFSAEEEPKKVNGIARGSLMYRYTLMPNFLARSTKAQRLAKRCSWSAPNSGNAVPPGAMSRKRACNQTPLIPTEESRWSNPSG